MIHCRPAANGSRFLFRSSSLAAENGFVMSIWQTLRHTKLANIFSLGMRAARPIAKDDGGCPQTGPIVCRQALAALAASRRRRFMMAMGSARWTVERQARSSGRIRLWRENAASLSQLADFARHAAIAALRWLLKDTIPAAGLLAWHAQGRNGMVKAPTASARNKTAQ